MKSYEFTTGPGVVQCKASYRIWPTKKFKSFCKHIIQGTYKIMMIKCLIIIVVIIIIIIISTILKG